MVELSLSNVDEIREEIAREMDGAPDRVLLARVMAVIRPPLTSLINEVNEGRRVIEAVRSVTGGGGLPPEWSKTWRKRAEKAEADLAAREDQASIVVPRPTEEPYGLDLEGGAYGDDHELGWQVVPYSSVRSWPSEASEADSILFRGAPGHISFAEARRFGAALIALADWAEAANGGGSE
jgi:hypothetical protein